jgi:hypothetical protein
LRSNPRVVPQQSVSRRREQESRKEYLRAIDLPAAEKQFALRELSLMGITAGALFPGIEGTCEQLRDRFFEDEE